MALGTNLSDQKRQVQILTLQAVAGSWSDYAHPELLKGSAAYVRETRQQSEQRFIELEQRDGNR